ncbi:hypothetical protein DFH09DRAFT_1095217 [Mycena vulgaris]|nr:hypothetical protein DFH09DRAFT_1095217 [Mycena vulgaris]
MEAGVTVIGLSAAGRQVEMMFSLTVGQLKNDRKAQFMLKKHEKVTKPPAQQYETLQKAHPATTNHVLAPRAPFADLGPKQRGPGMDSSVVPARCELRACQFGASERGASAYTLRPLCPCQLCAAHAKAHANPRLLCARFSRISTHPCTRLELPPHCIAPHRIAAAKSSGSGIPRTDTRDIAPSPRFRRPAIPQRIRIPTASTVRCGTRTITAQTYVVRPVTLAVPPPAFLEPTFYVDDDDDVLTLAGSAESTDTRFSFRMQSSSELHVQPRFSLVDTNTDDGEYVEREWDWEEAQTPTPFAEDKRFALPFQVTPLSASPRAREQQEWTGEWNRGDIQSVIKSLISRPNTSRSEPCTSL